MTLKYSAASFCQTKTFKIVLTSVFVLVSNRSLSPVSPCPEVQLCRRRSSQGYIRKASLNANCAPQVLADKDWCFYKQKISYSYTSNNRPWFIIEFCPFKIICVTPKKNWSRLPGIQWMQTAVKTELESTLYNRFTVKQQLQNNWLVLDRAPIYVLICSQSFSGTISLQLIGLRSPAKNAFKALGHTPSATRS